jgi:hypothetical protein
MIVIAEKAAAESMLFHNRSPVPFAACTARGREPNGTGRRGQRKSDAKPPEFFDIFEGFNSLSNIRGQPPENLHSLNITLALRTLIVVTGVAVMPDPAARMRA